MGKSAPKAPAAPDPKETAAAQTATNKETAYWNAVLNNVNQFTPYGSLTYEQTGGGKQYNMDAYNQAMDAWNGAGGGRTQQVIGSRTTGNSGMIDAQLADGSWISVPKAEWDANNGYRDGYTSTGNRGAMPQLEDFFVAESPPQFTSTINLSPEQQKLYETQVGQQQQLLDIGGDQLARIRQAVDSPFSFDGLGNEIQAQDVEQARLSAEEALMSRLNPQFGRDEEALRTRLINQGISQGSEAYNREMEAFGQNKNDARMQAVLNAARYGGDLQNQALQRRNQAIQEYSTQRNAPLNEYIGFTSGTQIQNPQFQSMGYGGAQPVDYAGLANNQFQSQLGQYNAKVAGNNATTSGLFGLGGTVASALPWATWLSDIRTKENIVADGVDNGFNMYRFNYKGDDKTYRGVMAQEVIETHPEAVTVNEDGLMMVNYDALGVQMTEV